MLRVTIFGKSLHDVTRAGSIRPITAKFNFKYCRVILIVLSMTSPTFAADAYDLTFSTYFGGSDWEHARDVTVDKSGNIYVVGGTASPDFPTTPGAYSQSQQTGGAQEFGPCDVFIVKFAPDGTLLWSTLIGGPNYDRAYGVEVDEQGYVYAAGPGRAFPLRMPFSRTSTAWTTAHTGCRTPSS